MMSAAATTATTALYMELQPDWDAANRGEDDAAAAGGCWLRVLERRVEFLVPNGDTSSGDEDDTEPPHEPQLAGTDGDEPTAKKQQQTKEPQRPRVRVTRPSPTREFQLPMDAGPNRGTTTMLKATPGALPGDGGDQGGEAQGRHLVAITQRERTWIEVAAYAAPSTRGAPALLRTVFQAPTATWDLDGEHARAVATDELIIRRRSPRTQLETIAVAGDEQHVAVGGADGLCRLWNPVDATPVRALVGHALDVTRVRFFPSHRVLLTGSLDFTLRIWSVESGLCGAVLRGHVGGITDVAIVGRGRNVISGARDGQVRLWCCANQETVATWSSDDHSPVRATALLGKASSPSAAPEVTHPGTEAVEYETEGKVVFAGLESGHTLGFDIRSRASVYDLDVVGPVSACATMTNNDNVLLTGTDDGILSSWDLRQTRSPLQVASRSSSAINSIFVGNDPTVVWTAHADGICSSWGPQLVAPANTAPFVATELTGPQYDPVRDVAVAPRTGRVWTACRDGLAREYIPHVTL